MKNICYFFLETKSYSVQIYEYIFFNNLYLRINTNSDFLSIYKLDFNSIYFPIFFLTHLILFELLILITI